MLYTLIVEHLLGQQSQSVSINDVLEVLSGSDLSTLCAMDRKFLDEIAISELKGTVKERTYRWIMNAFL